MGGKVSTVVASMEHEKLLAATRNTRAVVDTILEYLLKEMNTKDIYELSSPEKCKKYIVAMASTLDSIFYHIRVVPQKGKDGFIFFRAAKDVLEPETEAAKKQRYSLCVTISYFYTRIFQIYGALALSVIDEAQTMKSSRYLDMARGSILAPPGMAPYISRGIFGGMADTTRMAMPTEGGAWPYDDYDDDPYSRRYRERERPSRAIAAPYGYYPSAPPQPRSLGDFTFFTPYLDMGRVGEQGYRLRNTSTRAMSLRIAAPTSVLSAGTKAQLFVATSTVKDGFIYIDLAATTPSTGRVKVTIGDVHLGRTGKSYTMPADEIGQKTFTFLKDTDSNNYYLEGADAAKTASDTLIDIGNKALEYVRGLGGSDYIRVDPVTGKTISSAGVMEELRTTKIIHNLARLKPLSYCVARALQLLSSDPLPDRSAVSSVCTSKFLEARETKTGTIYSRSGIPEPGTGLDTNPGMSALSLLFFDLIDFASPKITMSTPAVAEFKDFLIQMDGIIHSSADTKRQAKDVSKLADVKMSACGKSAASITVPAGTVPEVMTYVRQLFDIQQKHTARVASILSELFWIQRNPSTKELKITIHPNIFKKGIPEIDRLNAVARKALVEYYKYCEFVYRQGMGVVLGTAEKKAVSGSSAVEAAEGAKRLMARTATASAAVAKKPVVATAPPPPPKPILKQPQLDRPRVAFAQGTKP